jgi:hypothetical protein
MPDPVPPAWTLLDLAPAYPGGQPGFDPATATASALLALHLPPRPDPATEPMLYAHWRDLILAPVDTPMAELTRNEPLSRGGAAGAGVRKPCRHSRNWSGAAAPARAGLRFTRIAGGWTIPAVTSAAPAKGSSLVSAWIGLGGATRSSQSMPQIGSEHGWLDGTRIDRLWCQWWLGSDPDGFLSWTLRPPKALLPGDRVLCSLLVTEADSVLCHIRRIPADPECLPELFAFKGTGKRPVVASSAEWIMERPRLVLDASPRLVAPELGRRRQLSAGGLAQLPGLAPQGAPQFQIEQAAARLGSRPRREVTPGQSALIALVETRPGPARLAKPIRPILRRSMAGEVLAFDYRP